MSSKPQAARIGAFGFAAVALGCAAIAAFLVGRLLDSGGYNKEPVKPVVIATQLLEPGRPIAKESLTVVKWPTSAIPEGAVASIEELYVGDEAPVPATAILKAEAVLRGRLATSAAGTGMGVLLQTGLRAVAVRVDEAVWRSRLVYPGARVDVVATVRDPHGRGSSSRIAVQNARVLALESETDVAMRRPRKEGEAQTAPPNGASGSVVTLEVSPGDVEVIALAMREGSIDLALRNGSDATLVTTAGATPYGISAFGDPLLPGDSSADPTGAIAAAVTSAGGGTRRIPIMTEVVRGGGRRRLELIAHDEPDPPRGGGGGGGIQVISPSR
ncbi:MAG: Flp pilus assembly protein CpaB [Myxococcales bacterium]|nr:Flp pilus assembly protein CpaB [Myxococcales bacterium]